MNGNDVKLHLRREATVLSWFSLFLPFERTRWRAVAPEESVCCNARHICISLSVSNGVDTFVQFVQHSFSSSSQFGWFLPRLLKFSMQIVEHNL